MEEREGEGKREGRREEGKRKGEEESTLCNISSSDLMCFCSSGVASRVSTLTAMMILEGW